MIVAVVFVSVLCLCFVCCFPWCCCVFDVCCVRFFFAVCVASVDFDCFVLLVVVLFVLLC